MVRINFDAIKQGVKTGAQFVTKNKKKIAAGAAVGGLYYAGSQNQDNQQASAAPEPLQYPSTYVDTAAPTEITPQDKLFKAGSTGTAVSKSITFTDIPQPVEVPKPQLPPEQQHLYATLGVVQTGPHAFSNDITPFITNKAEIEQAKAQNATNPLAQWIEARKAVAATAENIISARERYAKQYLDSNPLYSAMNGAIQHLVTMAAAGDGEAAAAILQYALPLKSQLENQAFTFAQNKAAQDPELQKAALEAKSAMDIAKMKLTALHKSVSETVHNSAGDVQKLASNPIVFHTALATGLPVPEAGQMVKNSKFFSTPLGKYVLDSASTDTGAPTNVEDFVAVHPDLGNNAVKHFVNFLAHKEQVPTASIAGKHFADFWNSSADLVASLQAQALQTAQAEIAKGGKAFANVDVNKLAQQHLAQQIATVYKNRVAQYKKIYGIATLADMALQMPNLDPTLRATLQRLADDKTARKIVAEGFRDIPHEQASNIMQILREQLAQSATVRSTYNLSSNLIDSIITKAELYPAQNPNGGTQ